MHCAAGLRAICLSDYRIFLLLHRCGLTISSLAAFAGLLLSVGDTSHCSVPNLIGFLLVLVSELQSTLVTFVHIPESIRTDQEGSSTGTDITWCGTSVTPECDIALGVQEVRLVPAGCY